LRAAAAFHARYPACGTHGVEQRIRIDCVGVGETGLLACHSTHPDTLIDAVDTFLDDSVLDAPCLVASRLEIQVPVVDRGAHERIERATERR
jgi:hypothetical protein